MLRSIHDKHSRRICIRGCGIAALLIAVCATAVDASPQAGVAQTNAAQKAAARPAAQAAPAASKIARHWRNSMVSPYARAAAQQSRASGQPVAAGHAPTMVQTMGHPHKPRPGTVKK